MRSELESALALAKTLPADALPQLCADLELIRMTCLARIAAPAVLAKPDELLDVPQAAKRLNVSENYLYRHSRRLPFTRRVGRKLLFSASGLELYLRRAR